MCAYQIEYKYRTISLSYIPIHHRTDTRIRPNVFGSLYHFNSKVVVVAVLRQSVYHGIDQPERIFAESLPHLPQLRLTGFQFFYALGSIPTARFQFVEIIKQIKASGKLSGGYDRFRHIVDSPAASGLRAAARRAAICFSNDSPTIRPDGVRR